MRFDVLCVGDATIDALLWLKEHDPHCRVDKETSEICFVAGSKIPVEETHFTLGGNACNVAVGLKRLGLNSALVAETGDDEFAQKIVKGLRKEQVSLDFLQQTPGTVATFSIGMNYGPDRTLFVHHVKRKHALDISSAQTKWIYLTSMGEEWKVLYQHVLSYISKSRVKLAFNPGTTQLREGVKGFRDVLAVTDILFLNREEAEWIIYGTEEVTDDQKKAKTLLQELHELGPKTICLTDGQRGSYASDYTGAFFSQATLPARRVQKTGVGDAYASGFLASWIVNGEDSKKALLWGAANAAGVLEHMGAQTGLLTKEQLEKRITNVA